MTQAKGDNWSQPAFPPSGWQCVHLGKVGEIVSGVTLGRKLGGSRARKVPYLRVANVKDAHLDLSDVYEVEASEEEIEKLRLRVGDLLLTEGGDVDKLGRGTLWQGELPLCIHQNHIFRVRFDPKQFSPEFISAQIASPCGKAYFLAHAKQTTGIATINQGVLARFPLIAPSITEQQRIASILRGQIAAVERARAAAGVRLEAANALANGYLRDAFNGITPLSVRPIPGPGLKGWEWQLLRDLARLESGHTPSRYRPEWWGGSIPWLALPDIRAFHGKVASDTVEFTNEHGIANSSSRVLPCLNFRRFV